MGDNKFIVVPQELFDYLTGAVIEMDEECYDFDEKTALMYEIYQSGRNDTMIEIITALEGALEVGCE